MKKLFTVGIILVSLLLFSCSRMKEFYGIPFGSTKEEVKTYLQNEKMVRRRKKKDKTSFI